MNSTSSSFLSSLSAAFAVGVYLAMGGEKNGRRSPRASSGRKASSDGYPSPARAASKPDDDDVAAASTDSRYTRNYGSARKVTFASSPPRGSRA